MSNKKLTILAVVAAATVALAIFQSRISGPAAGTASVTSYLIQGLTTTGIANIVLGKGSDGVELARQGTGFVVASKNNYPAMVKQINELIISCLDIQVGERISNNPESHEALEITDDKARNIVTFLDKAQKPITGIVIGKSTADGRGSYVRLISSDDVYIANNVPFLRSSAMDYIDESLLKVDRKEIEQVTVTGPQDRYTLKPADANGVDVVLENVPTGKKPKDDDCKQVFTALENLRFTDVKKESAATEDLNFDRTYVCRLKNTTVYTFKLAKKGDKTYAKCRAEFLDKSKVTVTGKESQQELDKNEAKLLAHDAANAFLEKHKGWIYELPTRQGGNLTKKLSDLIEDIEKKTQETDSQTSAELPAEAGDSE